MLTLSCFGSIEYSRNKDELEKYKVIAADQEQELNFRNKLSELLSIKKIKVCQLTEEKSKLEKMLSCYIKKDSTCKKVSDLKILKFKKEIEKLKNENLLLQSEIGDISQEKKKNDLLASEYSRNKDELEKYKVIAADQE
ncbi:unnamed protein product [Rhizophagus irregularis]|nr:unnamed protein product [Rhizophagus irregularis]CAB4412302.1 unnamed protein product [Rhizophagus irregularis]